MLLRVLLLLIAQLDPSDPLSVPDLLNTASVIFGRPPVPVPLPPRPRAPPSCEPYKLGACPFDDLTPDEIRTTVRLVTASYPPATRPALRYPIIRTQEPSKAQWLAAGVSAGAILQQRLSYAAVFDYAAGRLREFMVDLGVKRIVSQAEIPDGAAPAILMTEFAQAEALVRANMEWQAAIRRRTLDPGQARLDILSLDPYPSGNGTSFNESAPGRSLRVVTYYQDALSRFWYWTVVEGLLTTVDIRAGVVLYVHDHLTAAKLAPGLREVNTSRGDADDKLKPLFISQPEGTSIQVHGQRLEWYKWKFQWSMDPIYGLQLYHVSYHADCEQRSVAYKISIGEIFVPYGPSDETWHWRAGFDAGHYGLTVTANSLKRGVDVPENALLFDCLIVDDTTGVPHTLPGCVAAYEKDATLLYKHVNWQTLDTDAKRGRVLVLTFMSAQGNYDYGFDYVFHMDGRLEVRTRLTGIVQPRGVPQEVNDPGCIEDCLDLSNNYLVGPVHQHFVNYRIDLDVDGSRNHVLQVDVVPDEDKGSFAVQKKIIPTETVRDHNPATSRSWRVVNAGAGSRNKFGTPRGYTLKPAALAYSYLTERSPFWLFTPFVRHPFWVTRYHDEEQTPGYKYPRSQRTAWSTNTSGLPDYVANEESVADEDLVLWYTFGVTHAPRADEWPIMNVEDVHGFSLVPTNFMSHNEEVLLEGHCKSRSSDKELKIKAAMNKMIDH